GYGQQQWSPTPQPGSGGGGNGKVIGIVIAAVVALVLIGIGGFFGVRALTGDDDPKRTKASDGPTSGATDGSDATAKGTDPTDQPSSTVRPTGIQCTGGSPEPAKPPATTAKAIRGGGLTVPVLPGYEADPGYAAAHSFADGVQV